jgi:hypothetical protein
MIMDWREISGNWVMVPQRPKAIVHFLGGAFVATAPQLTYRLLLESLVRQGYAVIATPFVNTFDHGAIARQVLLAFDRALDYLHDRAILRPSLPVYGLGHSMGCKLHLLINTVYAEPRAGNMLVSFNNYPARRSIPFLEQMLQIAPSFMVEFTPSPDETFRLVQEEYPVQRTLLIQFTNDTIDQTQVLSDVIRKRFPDSTHLKVLSGNHLTPLGQDVDWKVGAEFTPWDALGQYVRQEVFRDLRQLERQILLWLDPFTAL